MTKQRLTELTTLLQKACRAYYAENREIMSNKVYDQLYDELQAGEQELGIILSGSPTQKVGYETVSGLQKVEHEIAALSLDKTKDRNYLADWLGHEEGLLSWKMDGLTIVATYAEGMLQKAVTRGNGHIGEDVTHNARFFIGLPVSIPTKEKVIVRGEAVIRYLDFVEINAELPADEQYKNPRNLASGSVRVLESEKAAGRKIHFKAFTFANALDHGIISTEAALNTLSSWGFETVEWARVSSSSVAKIVGKFEEIFLMTPPPYPSDGLVLTYDDIPYGESLGTTGKYPRNAIAFKWADETAETTLCSVDWTASRSGLINPVAVFDPVELEGTTVTRASLHNVSYLQNLQLGIGDTITVYKANMIIPQVDENLTAGEHLAVEIPDTCPVCGGKTVVKIGADKNTRSLFCTNADCPAKHLGDYERMVSRDALNIVGLSGAKLEALVDNGFIHNIFDLFQLERYRDQIVAMEGFGEKSYQNLQDAITASKKTTFRQFFYCLGIPGCGHDVAKILEEFLKGTKKTEALRNLLESEDSISKLMVMDGIGPVKAETMANWYKEHKAIFDGLLQILEISDDTIESVTIQYRLTGMTFVITGSLNHFKNRKELSLNIENKGGKVSGSVSSKTTYLISNEPSTSAKSMKAAALGVPVITEEEYLKKYC